MKEVNYKLTPYKAYCRPILMHMVLICSLASNTFQIEVVTDELLYKTLPETLTEITSKEILNSDN